MKSRMLRGQMNCTDIMLNIGSRTQKGIYCITPLGSETGNTTLEQQKS